MGIDLMGLQHHGKAQTVFLCGDRERIERERERGIGTLQWDGPVLGEEINEKWGQGLRNEEKAHLREGVTWEFKSNLWSFSN